MQCKYFYQYSTDKYLIICKHWNYILHNCDSNGSLESDQQDVGWEEATYFIPGEPETHRGRMSLVCVVALTIMLIVASFSVAAQQNIMILQNTSFSSTSNATIIMMKELTNCCSQPPTVQTQFSGGSQTRG